MRGILDTMEHAYLNRVGTDIFDSYGLLIHTGIFHEENRRSIKKKGFFCKFYIIDRSFRGERTNCRLKHFVC